MRYCLKAFYDIIKAEIISSLFFSKNLMLCIDKFL